MKWLSNTYNPSLPDAPMHVVSDGDTPPGEAWRQHIEWLRDKNIGRPKATKWYTVEQLEDMNMVGAYQRQGLDILTLSNLRFVLGEPTTPRRSR